MHRWPFTPLATAMLQALNNLVFFHTGVPLKQMQMEITSQERMSLDSAVHNVPNTASAKQSAVPSPMFPVFFPSIIRVRPTMHALLTTKTQAKHGAPPR